MPKNAKITVKKFCQMATLQSTGREMLGAFLFPPCASKEAIWQNFFRTFSSFPEGKCIFYHFSLRKTRQTLQVCHVFSRFGSIISFGAPAPLGKDFGK